MPTLSPASLLLESYVKAYVDAHASIEKIDDATKKDLESYATLMFYQELIKSTVSFDMVQLGQNDLLKALVKVVDERVSMFSETENQQLSELFLSNLAKVMEEYFARLSKHLTPEQIDTMKETLKASQPSV